MNKHKNSIISSILAGIILLFSFTSPVFAADIPSLELKLNESTDNGNYLSIYVSSPESVTAIDFTLTVLDVEAYTLSELTVKTEGAADINGEYSQEDKLIYHFENDDAKLSFTGFFNDNTATDTDIHLCDVKLTKGNNAENGTHVLLTYTISADSFTIPGNIRFSLNDGKNIEKNSISAYYSGDVDFSGKVTASDARTILRASVGIDKIVMSAFPYADTDHNGIINAADARTALRTSVGLENEVLHSFSIQTKNGTTCDSKPEFYFFCTLTGTTYTLKKDVSEHIYRDKDCIHNKECILCHKKLENADGHSFGENGSCSVCGKSEAELIHVKDLSSSLLDNVSYYDSAASNALKTNDYRAYIKNAVQAARQLKICLDSTKNTVGAYEIHNELKKAYSLRFNAILAVTNDSGNIPLTEESFRAIKEAADLSAFNISYVKTLISNIDKEAA